MITGTWRQSQHAYFPLTVAPWQRRNCPTKDVACRCSITLKIAKHVPIIINLPSVNPTLHQIDNNKRFNLTLLHCCLSTYNNLLQCFGMFKGQHESLCIHFSTAVFRTEKNSLYDDFIRYDLYSLRTFLRLHNGQLEEHIGDTKMPTNDRLPLDWKYFKYGGAQVHTRYIQQWRDWCTLVMQNCRCRISSLSYRAS